MADNIETYVVILRPDPIIAGRLPLQELAKIVSGAFSVPVLDTAARLRRTWGLLHKTDSIDEAKTLSKILAANGFGSLVLPSLNLKKVPPLKVIRKAAPVSEGFLFSESGTMGAPHEKEKEFEKLVPWDGFSLVCAGGFYEEGGLSTGKKEKLEEGVTAVKVITTVALAAAGLPSFGKLKPAVNKGGGVEQKEKKFKFYMDMFSRQGSQHFRVCGDAFDYSFLGGRKEPSALPNFRKLVSDVLGFMPGALRNRGAAAIEKGAGDGFKYGDRQEYEGERSWLFQFCEL